jgi:FkbM family methyltransferase
MTDLPRLLKRVHRFRRDAVHGGWRAFGRRRRKAALVALLRRDWPGGYVLTDGGDLAHVPSPFDARGERLLFYGFAPPTGVLAFAPRGGVVIDVGANLGEWAVPFAKAVGPQGRVLCCEPNPLVAASLAATLAINGLVQARVVETALSDHDGDGRLAIDAADSGQSRLAKNGIAVPVRRLDSLAAEAALNRVDLIKIDVEGHETAVLAGAAETLAHFRPTLIFESGHETAEDRALLANFLEARSYRIVAVLHDYGALESTLDDYRAAAGSCAGREPHNLLALPLKR